MKSDVELGAEEGLIEAIVALQALAGLHESEKGVREGLSWMGKREREATLQTFRTRILARTTETMMKETVTRYLGTCQICEQEQKLHDGKMVHHGFKRPGHGSIEGDCYGVYAVPYQVSCDLVKKYLSVVSEQIVSAEARLLALETPGTVKTLTKMSGPRSIYRKTETYTLGETPMHVWNRELERAAADVRGRIYFMKKDITRLEARIAAWKPAPIRTIEEREAEEKAVKDVRAAERVAARQMRADKAAATKAKQEALQAKREAIKQDFKSRFLALAEAPESSMRKELACGIAREMGMKKYFFFYADEGLDHVDFHRCPRSQISRSEAQLL